jgi:hypothetical protein
MIDHRLVVRVCLWREILLNKFIIGIILYTGHAMLLEHLRQVG